MARFKLNSSSSPLPARTLVRLSLSLLGFTVAAALAALAQGDLLLFAILWIPLTFYWKGESAAAQQAKKRRSSRLQSIMMLLRPVAGLIAGNVLYVLFTLAVLLLSLVLKGRAIKVSYKQS